MFASALAPKKCVCKSTVRNAQYSHIVCMYERLRVCEYTFYVCSTSTRVCYTGTYECGICLFVHMLLVAGSVAIYRAPYRPSYLTQSSVCGAHTTQSACVCLSVCVCMLTTITTSDSNIATSEQRQCEEDDDDDFLKMYS